MRGHIQIFASTELEDDIPYVDQLSLSLFRCHVLAVSGRVVHLLARRLLAQNNCSMAASSEDELSTAAAQRVARDAEATSSCDGDAEPVNADGSDSDDSGTAAALTVGSMFAYRGRQLAAHMRDCKRWRSHLDVDADTQAAIDHSNNHRAIRQQEIIPIGKDTADVNAGDARRKPQGGNRFYCWVPMAMLRVCFGTLVMALASVKSCNKRRRIRNASLKGRKKRKAHAKPLARGTRAVADECGTSATHISQIRHAVASVIIGARDRIIDALHHASWGVLLLTYDETDQVLLRRRKLTSRPTASGRPRYKAVSVTRNVMMVHGILLWNVLGATVAQHLELICVPAILASQSARCILSAIF